MKHLTLPEDYQTTSKNVINCINNDLANNSTMFYLFRGKPGRGKSYLAKIIIDHVRTQTPELIQKAEDKLEEYRDLKFDAEGEELTKLELKINQGMAYIARLKKVHSKAVFDSMDNLSYSYSQNAMTWQWDIPLWIDDLGKERRTESARGFVANLFERKYNEFKSLKDNEFSLFIVTTELTDDQISERYGEHILSRFNEMFLHVLFTNKDFRQTKKRIVK